MATHCP